MSLERGLSICSLLLNVVLGPLFGQPNSLTFRKADSLVVAISIFDPFQLQKKY